MGLKLVIDQSQSGNERKTAMTIDCREPEIGSEPDIPPSGPAEN